MQPLAPNRVGRWFLEAIRQYPFRSGSVFVLSLLSSVADGVSVSLLIPLLTLLFDGDAAMRSSVPGLEGVLLAMARIAPPGRELVAVASAIVVLIAFRCVISGIYSWMSNWISGRISCELRAKMHENLLKVDYEYICLNDGSRLLNILDGEAWNATEAITTYFGLFTSFCMAAVLSGLLMVVSWKLTLVVAVSVGAASLSLLAFSNKVRALGGEQLRAGEELYERAVELLSAMRMIRAFGRESQTQRAYDTASERLFGVSMRSVRVADLASATEEVLYALMFLVTIFVALGLGLGGATLVAYLALLHRLQPHVRAIDSARRYLVSLEASVAVVSEVLELQHWAPSTPHSLPASTLERSLRFEDISFSYAGKDKENRAALAAVNLEIAAGKITAIIGASGAGKSTLINLLFRFYDPSAGVIYVDGVPLTQLDLSSWRKQLAIAGQDAELLGATIRENIACGKEGASFDEIVDAAKRASIHEFICQLPNGYDTRVGSRGLLLSGGQRQRIGLARALVRRSSILVLDEATNALDSLTEHEVLSSLAELRANTTVILIAHRLSTIRNADQVIALANGGVVEVGAPAELLKRKSLYHQMVQLQDVTSGQDASADLLSDFRSRSEESAPGNRLP